MQVIVQRLLGLRQVIGQLPSYLFHWLFSWLYSTEILRTKAAWTPYPMVRLLLLRRGGVSLGQKVRVNFGDLLLGSGRSPCALELGDRAAVGPYVTFVTSSAPNESVLRDHPEVQRMIKDFGPIHVEADAWIGANVVILPGVTVGRGAIVGAGAVVAKNVPAWTVVAGVPARVVRTLSPPGQ